MKNWLEIAKEENSKFNNSDYGKISDGQARQWDAAVRGGITSGNKNKKNGQLSKAGTVSAKKQWKENREGELIKSKKGGESARDNKKGCHSLSKKELSKAGKKGYSNGLGKFSSEEKSKIGKKAGYASREKNAKLKPEDVLYARKVFIPRHPEFGVVPLSKKFGVTECTLRSAIKGKSFIDI